MSDNPVLTDHQKGELEKATAKGIGAFIGSPGVGKSFCVAQLAKSIIGKYGVDSLAIAAPTGKAAVRITSMLSNAGIETKAKTIHSLLGLTGEDDSFSINGDEPLPFMFVLLDESSMIDTTLASRLMNACRRGCHVLWTGDPNQLPPVGHGAPLRDLIAAGVPYGELREIKRNSGGIVEACAAIRDGQPWEPGDNLILNNSSNQLDAVNTELAVAKNNGLDPVWDCQVLVAVNEKSPLSRKAVNQFLQAEWNPNAKVAGTTFRVADKVVCLKNSDFALIEDDAGKAEQGDKVRVMNGELGKVIEIADKYLLIRVEDPYRLIRVPRAGGESDEGAGCNWNLGYALSTHKSQGSEWPVVIVLIDEYPGAKMVCSREWLYTSISRAKQLCVVVGKKSTAAMMCRRVSINKRKTFLRELILKKVSTMEMAGM